jgi:hypothetical protein
MTEQLDSLKTKLLCASTDVMERDAKKKVTGHCVGREADLQVRAQ